MNRFVKTIFIIKCLVVAELLMFGCMAIGELFIDPSLFSGFLSKPHLWVGVLIETAIATLPVCFIGALILSKTSFRSEKSFLLGSLGVWLLLCSTVVGLYKIFYFPREWKLTLLHPGILFGWVIPGVLIIGCFVWFSEKLYFVQQRRNINAQG